MTLKQLVIIAISVIIIGILPFAMFLGFSITQSVCWSETPLSSRTWVSVFLVDWLLYFTIFLAIWLFVLFFSGKTFRSGHSLNWYWTSALIWLFDIGWLAAVSTQISRYGTSDCNPDLLIAAIVLLSLKLIWTPFALFMVCMGG
jgi:hypothetical protein